MLPSEAIINEYSAHHGSVRKQDDRQRVKTINPWEPSLKSRDTNLPIIDNKIKGF